MGCTATDRLADTQLQVPTDVRGVRDTGKQSGTQVHNRRMHSVIVMDTLSYTVCRTHTGTRTVCELQECTQTRRYTRTHAELYTDTQVHADTCKFTHGHMRSYTRTHAYLHTELHTGMHRVTDGHRQLHTALLRHISSYTHGYLHAVTHTRPHTTPPPWAHTHPQIGCPQQGGTPHPISSTRRCPSVLVPAVASCSLPSLSPAPSSPGWDRLWNGQKPLQRANGPQESRWRAMSCSSPGPAGRNRQGHLRTQGECSLFWGSRSPQQSGAEPHPCLVKVQVDHGWTLTHPCYFGNARPVPVECWPAPCLLWHPSTQTVPSRDRKGPLGQGWAVSQDCVIAHCLFS